MKTHRLMEVSLTGNDVAGGPVSRKRLRERAVQLAGLAGRSPQDASKSDWDQAKVEMIGEPDMAPNEPIMAPAGQTGSFLG
jgi:hypothetical protein